MAENINNILTRGYTGTIAGQLVLKIRNGKPYYSSRPTFKKGRKPTANQSRAREKFARAVRYGKTVIDDPELNAWYHKAAKPEQSAYTAAISDANEPPQLNNLNTEDYGGKAGQIITVIAVDNFWVEKVSVAIIAANGDIIEQGAAVPDSIFHTWTYTTSVTHENTTGILIRVTAEDKPKNQAVLEKTL